MLSDIATIWGAAWPIFAILSNGLSAPNREPNPSSKPLTNPPALSAAMPTAMPINAGPSASILDIGTSLILASPLNSVSIAGAAIAAAIANGTSAKPNAPIAIAPGIINGIAKPKAAATAARPTNVTNPLAIDSQLKSPNISNALAATNIAPDIINIAPAPNNALGLPTASSPFPSPVNAPCNRPPMPLPMLAPALPIALLREVIAVLMPLLILPIALPIDLLREVIAVLMPLLILPIALLIPLDKLVIALLTPLLRFVSMSDMPLLMSFIPSAIFFVNLCDAFPAFSIAPAPKSPAGLPPAAPPPPPPPPPGSLPLIHPPSLSLSPPVALLNPLPSNSVAFPAPFIMVSASPDIILGMPMPNAFIPTAATPSAPTNLPITLTTPPSVIVLANPDSFSPIQANGAIILSRVGFNVFPSHSNGDMITSNTFPIAFPNHLKGASTKPNALERAPPVEVSIFPINLNGASTNPNAFESALPADFNVFPMNLNGAST